jgi:hypothetical protein
MRVDADEEETLEEKIPLDIEEKLNRNGRWYHASGSGDPLRRVLANDFTMYVASAEVVQQKVNNGVDRIVIWACRASDGCCSSICFLSN